MRIRFALASLPILFSLLAFVPAQADSVIHNKSSNYVRLHADSSGSFAGATVTDTSTSTPPDATAAPFYSEPHPPYQNSISAPISMVPTTGLAKDQLKGIFDITYVFGNTPGWPGAPASDGGATWDHLEFNIDSDISTGDAHNSAGEPASAKLRSNGSASFFIDTSFFRPPGTPLAAGAIAGHITIPPLGPLDTIYESLVLSVQDNGSVVGTFAPTSSSGSAGAILDVRAGHSYRVDVAYGANVPYGIDPHAHYNISIGVTPEPTGLRMMFSALLVMRRRCTHGRSA